MNKFSKLATVSMLTLGLAASGVALANHHQGDSMRGDKSNKQQRMMHKGHFFGEQSLAQLQIILELSDEQVTQISALLEQAKTSAQAEPEANKETKKAQKEQIKSQLDAGEIDKEDVREMMQEHRDTQKIKRDELRATISALLSDEQNAKLAALEELKKPQQKNDRKNHDGRGYGDKNKQNKGE